MPDSETYNDSFRAALNDYFTLLNRGYAEKPALKLVGDRFRLSGRQRLILYRGVAPESKQRNRRKKITLGGRNQHLHIDGYNVLFTIMNYLLGKSIFIANDGFLRDAGESYGKIENQQLLSRSVDLLLDYLSARKYGPVSIYLDENVKNRCSHARLLEKGSVSRDFPSEIITGRQVDNRLKLIGEGILATSDSQIIDQTSLQVIDLARHLLEETFQVRIPELRTLTRKN